MKRAFVPPRAAPGTASAPVTTKAKTSARHTPAPNKPAEAAADDADACYYRVMYTKRMPQKVCMDHSACELSLPMRRICQFAGPELGTAQKRKNKAFSDGILEVKSGDICILYDSVSRTVPRAMLSLTISLVSSAVARTAVPESCCCARRAR